MRLEEFVLLRCMFSSSAHISSRSNSVISLLESFPPLTPIRRLYARLRSSLQDIAETKDLTVFSTQLKMGSKIGVEGQAGVCGAIFEGNSRAFMLKVFNDDTSLGDLKRLETTSLLIMSRVKIWRHWYRPNLNGAITMRSWVDTLSHLQHQASNIQLHTIRFGMSSSLIGIGFNIRLFFESASQVGKFGTL
ncbi:hypothetical protein M758_10G078400 [Ceratodon purpureus]|nr:hypothetical protein M758_10G078400 [Ceratodon purpureus]